jgi:hypothetical protein
MGVHPPRAGHLPLAAGAAAQHLRDQPHRPGVPGPVPAAALHQPAPSRHRSGPGADRQRVLARRRRLVRLLRAVQHLPCPRRALAGHPALDRGAGSRPCRRDLHQRGRAPLGDPPRACAGLRRQHPRCGRELRPRRSTGGAGLPDRPALVPPLRRRGAGLVRLGAGPRPDLHRRRPGAAAGDGTRWPGSARCATARRRSRPPAPQATTAPRSTTTWGSASTRTSARGSSA